MMSPRRTVSRDTGTITPRGRPVRSPVARPRSIGITSSRSGPVMGRRHDGSWMASPISETALSRGLARPVETLWTMKTATPWRPGTVSTPSPVISPHCPRTSWTRCAGRLRIGLVSDAEVTDAAPPDCSLVSQAFCSALPILSSGPPAEAWHPSRSLFWTRPTRRHCARPCSTRGADRPMSCS